MNTVNRATKRLQAAIAELDAAWEGLKDACVAPVRLSDIVLIKKDAPSTMKMFASSARMPHYLEKECPECRQATLIKRDDGYCLCQTCGARSGRGHRSISERRRM